MPRRKPIPTAVGPREQFGPTFLCAMGSFLLFVTGQILAMNQLAWFGADPRNAANTFWFNLTFFFPLHLSGLLLAIGSTFFYVRSLIAVTKGSRRLTLAKAATFVPALPVLAFVLFLVAQVVTLSMRAPPVE